MFQLVLMDQLALVVDLSDQLVMNLYKLTVKILDQLFERHLKTYIQHLSTLISKTLIPPQVHLILTAFLS